MAGESGFAAELLIRSAPGYAGVAASQLLEREPGLREQAGALAAWKTHLTQRVLELAAALGADEPLLFRERVRWSRKTFAARGQDERLIGSSLNCLKTVLGESLPEKAREAAVTYVDEALTSLAEPVPGPDESFLTPDTPSGRLALTYLQSILEGDTARATQSIMDAVKDGLDVTVAYLDVLMPAQKEIGRLWHANEVSVAEEHLVTATTQRTMSVLAQTSPRAESNGLTVLAACVPGNIHEIGIRALTDLFYLAGWRSVYLGADVPIAEIPAALAAFDVDLLLLGATLSTQLKSAEQAVRTVRTYYDQPVRIMVGGAAFDEAPHIWNKMGADAYAATALDAIQKGRDLLSN